MNRKLVCSLLCSAGLLPLGPAFAQNADPCAIDTKVRTDGTVELSNIGNTGKCEVAPAPRSATPNAAPTAMPVVTGDSASPATGADSGADSGADRGADRGTSAAAAPAGAPSSPTANQKDPRENYRDAMLAGAPGTTAANPAVARRYKMMDKATYQSTVLGGGAPGSDVGGTGPQ